jgi:hypothetical protein
VTKGQRDLLLVCGHIIEAAHQRAPQEVTGLSWRVDAGSGASGSWKRVSGPSAAWC